MFTNTAKEQNKKYNSNVVQLGDRVLGLFTLQILHTPIYCQVLESSACVGKINAGCTLYIIDLSFIFIVTSKFR